MDPNSIRSDDEANNFQEIDDDLDAFDQDVRNELMHKLENPSQIQDDALGLLNIDRPKGQTKKIKQLTEEQRIVKQLRSRNAGMFFQRVRILFLRQFADDISQTVFIYTHFTEIVAESLSFFDFTLLQDYIKLKDQKESQISLSNLLTFLRKVRKLLKQNNCGIPDNQMLWAFCQSLKIGCRKIHFFDLAENAEEQFYKLKYDTGAKKNKREKNKGKEDEKMKRKIEKILESQEDEQGEIEEQKYEYEEINKSKSQSHEPRMITDRDKNLLRKRNFKYSYFQLFDPVGSKWVLINSSILVIEDMDQFKLNILQGFSIVSFYSTKILHFKPKFICLQEERFLRNIETTDVGLHFGDNFKLMLKRKKRIGCKVIVKQSIQRGSFWKNLDLLEEFDQKIIKHDLEQDLELQIMNFPRDKTQMVLNQYFTVPSLIPQYSILNQLAKPLPKIKFQEENVFLKRDVIPISSRNGWIDKGRRVKRQEVPIKKTENRMKKVTELFLFEQTVPFEIQIDPKTGNFIVDDTYSNIYVPEDFEIPKAMTLTTKKIGYVCNKNKIRYSLVVQGFKMSGGRLLPNDIGYIFYRQDQKKIMKLFEERMTYLEENKEKNRYKVLVTMWRKLFKALELSQMYEQHSK